MMNPHDFQHGILAASIAIGVSEWEQAAPERFRELYPGLIWNSDGV
jgi:hypothetical protein